MYLTWNIHLIVKMKQESRELIVCYIVLYVMMGVLTEIQLLIHKHTALLIRALISGAGLFVWRTVMFLNELLQRQYIHLACLSGRESGKVTRRGRRGWRVDTIYECISGQTYRWVTHVTYIGTDKNKRLVCRHVTVMCLRSV